MRIQEECGIVESKMASLKDHASKMAKLSYPVEYFLKFYDTYEDLPTIFIITPTDSSRITQLADLTRLRNTLWLVPKIFWIIVEDRFQMSDKLGRFLNNSYIPHVHLVEKTPDRLKIQSDDRTKPKGVIQRNKALDWLRRNVEVNVNGVVFFADDDNTYDIRVFEEMRYTKIISTWPVGYPGSSLYEGPVCKDNKIVSWFCSWECERRTFPLDTASFAINLQVLLNNNAMFTQSSKGGFLESDFLARFVKLNDFEPKANCSKVLVWHTKTFDSGKRINKKFEKLYDWNVLENL